MAVVAIKADEMAETLAAARAAGYEVLAPTRAAGGWAFASYDGGPPDLDGYLLTTLSAKAAVLPQLEEVLRYDGDGAEAAAAPPARRLLFGVRPCDARALALVDKVYAGGRGFRDPLYEPRRANTILAVLACDLPAPTCFCPAVGGGPADASAADVMVYRTSDGWLLESETAKGEALLAALKLKPAREADVNKAKERYAALAAAMAPGPWDLEAVRARLYERFDAPAWEEIASRCVSCGACTFVCPSCYCFDVADEGKHGRGARLRFWDACTQKLFTLHASGHNPRERKAARYRQRVLHKFHYFHANWGETLCVGCGRCVVACPTNVDIREAVALVAGE